MTGDDNLAAYIAAAGYTVLSYTARGFGEGESGGRVTIAGPDEINDLKQVIDWLMDDPDDVISPRVTRIGVVGGSYGGGHSLQIASDPRVAAVVPLIGWTDLEQALYPNGVINYRLGIGQFYSGLERQTGSAPFYNYDRLLFEMFDTGAEGRALSQEVKQALAARSVAERGPRRAPRVERLAPADRAHLYHSILGRLPVSFDAGDGHIRPDHRDETDIPGQDGPPARRP